MARLYAAFALNSLRFEGTAIPRKSYKTLSHTWSEPLIARPSRRSVEER
jgi:hypothetical protein